MPETNYEEKILNVLMKFPEDVAEIRSNLSEDYFLNPQLKAIYKVVTAYYDLSDGQTPTLDILLRELDRTSPGNTEAFKNLSERVFEPEAEEDRPHSAYYVQALGEAWTGSELKTKMLEAVDLIQDKKDVQGAVRILQEEIRLPTNAFIQGDLVNDLYTVVEDMDYRQKHPELYAGIHIGFPSIDKRTHGHCRGELVVVVGGTGVGKSMVLGQIGINVAMQKKNVLLVTVENSNLAYMNRLYSNISKVPYDAFKRNLLSKRERLTWLDAMGKLPDPFNLKVVEFPEGCSSRDIWLYMKNLPYEIDYLIVDQITNMNPNDIANHPPMSWTWYGQIALDLKRLSGYAYGNKGLPILSAAQAAGGTLGKKELTTDDIAMAKIIQHHVHGSFYVTKEEDAYYMGASKYRDAFIEVFPIFPEFKYWTVNERPLSMAESTGVNIGHVPEEKPAPQESGLKEGDVL